LEAALASTFGHPGGNVTMTTRPRLLMTRNPGKVQRTLADIAMSQNALLGSRWAAQQCIDATRRELHNLEAATRRVVMTSLSGPVPPNSNADVLAATLTDRHRHFLAQMESDTATAEHLAERTARTVDVLRGLADSLGARYERLVILVIGSVGAGVALGALVDKEKASWMYHNMGVGLRRSLADPARDAGSLMALQIIGIGIGAILGYLLTWLVMKIARW
jgi:hypothetical protein